MSTPGNHSSFAPGIHLLVDSWGARHLTDAVAIETALRKAVSDCGATLLHIHLHRFGEEAGITGVAVLAESHISIHTWPESGFVAIDIFMCGSCNPHIAWKSLEEFFRPARIRISEHQRGETPALATIKGVNHGIV